MGYHSQLGGRKTFFDVALNDVGDQIEGFFMESFLFQISLHDRRIRDKYFYRFLHIGRFDIGDL